MIILVFFFNLCCLILSLAKWQYEKKNAGRISAHENFSN